MSTIFASLTTASVADTASYQPRGFQLDGTLAVQSGMMYATDAGTNVLNNSEVGAQFAWLYVDPGYPTSSIVVTGLFPDQFAVFGVDEMGLTASGYLLDIAKDSNGYDFSLVPFTGGVINDSAVVQIAASVPFLATDPLTVTVTADSVAVTVNGTQVAYQSGLQMSGTIVGYATEANQISGNGLTRLSILTTPSTYKATGELLQGTIVPPTNYPDPTWENVNTHQIDWAYSMPGVPQNVVVNYDGNSWYNDVNGNEKVQLYVSWDQAPNAVRYEVYGNGDLLTTVDTDLATVSDLPIDTNYIFTVVAYDHAGRASSPSDPVTQNTLD